ncbi:MAG: hypothetical protein AAGE43_08405 [Pseudomonadota bacterium]
MDTHVHAAITLTAVLLLNAACAYQPDTASPVAQPSQGPASCSGPFRLDSLHPIGGDPAPVAVYKELCDGGLYLLDGSSFATLLLINESWRLETLRTLRWQEAEQALIVQADYITGIGPTGVVPFFVEFTVEPGSEGWQVRDTTNREAALKDAVAEIVAEDGTVEILTAHQLQALSLTANGEPYPIAVDFEQNRLIVSSQWLTSGSERITDVNVWKNRLAYFITFKTSSPKVGTTDMKHSIIYAVLPKDYRAISVGDRELDATAIRVKTGVIDRGSFRGASTP